MCVDYGRNWVKLHCGCVLSLRVSKTTSFFFLRAAIRYAKQNVSKMFFVGNAQPSPVSSGFGGSKSVSSPVTLGTNGTSPVSAATTSAPEGPFKPATQLKSGSVMDILGGAGGKSSETSATSPSVKPAGQLKQGSVMDVLGGKCKCLGESLELQY